MASSVQKAGSDIYCVQNDLNVWLGIASQLSILVDLAGGSYGINGATLSSFVFSALQ